MIPKTVLIVALVLLSHNSYSQASCEEIMIVGSNGKSITRYTSLRDTGNLRHYIHDVKDTSRFMYIFPPVASLRKDEFDSLYMDFQSSGHALITSDSQSVTEGQGRFYYNNGAHPIGFVSNGPKGFVGGMFEMKRAGCLWVLPTDFEFWSYECNKPGTWRLHDNVLSFIGSNVNDLIFNISWKQRPPKVDSSIVSIFEGLKTTSNSLSVIPTQQGARIELSESVLFASGSAVISPGGKLLLSKIAKELKSLGRYRVRLTGHTDSIELAPHAQFQSNWQLSAVRAATCAENLIKEEIPENSLEVVAAGPNRPAAPNSTAEGRAKNRRIELEVIR